MVHEPYYRLVLRGQKIDGIVTRSDLLKLPVRLLAFARITHVELILANLIKKRFNDNDSWLYMLDDDRQRGVKNKQRWLRLQQADPPLLELTGLRDKSNIVAQLYKPGASFVSDMNEVTELRNKLAHAGDFAPDIESIKAFLERLELADAWISGLGQLSPM